MAKKEIKEIDKPILVEPSTLYCMKGKVKCTYFCDNLKERHFCGVDLKDIKWVTDNMAPDWCPKRMAALFPSK